MKFMKHLKYLLKSYLYFYTKKNIFQFEKTNSEHKHKDTYFKPYHLLRSTTAIPLTSSSTHSNFCCFYDQSAQL